LREQDPFRFIKRLPWEKITIWAIFLLLIYLLRDFFDVLFLTFIISYIAHNLVTWACERMGIGDKPSHPLRYLNTVLVFLVFLGLLTGAGWLVLPKVFEQGKRLGEQAQDLIPAASRPLASEDRADAVLRDTLGEKAYGDFRDTPGYYPLRAELTQVFRRLPGHEGAARDFKKEEAILPRLDLKPENGEVTPHLRPVQRRDIRYHLDNILKAGMGRARFEEFQASPSYELTYGRVVTSLQNTATENLPVFADLLTTVATKIFTYSMHFLISIIFSFMIVIGIPRFGKAVQSLEESRLSEFYREITPSIVSFGRSMGMAFQGQAVIALVNTALTLVGLVILGIPNPIALSVIVFVCSFIPVLGVFISSAPIALVALQGGGILLAFESLVMITIIHVIEAYILNPRILGSVMKMHPLMVLVILFAGEHFFGIWGLLIAVPLVHYLFNHVILKQPVPERRLKRTGAIPVVRECDESGVTDAPPSEDPLSKE
jgi:predicted PurR-regulated permease PerM